MIADFVVNCFFYGACTLALLACGAFGGLLASAIPYFIYDTFMDDCSDRVRDTFFAIACVLLPVIFGLMTTWTVYDKLGRRPEHDTTPIVEVKREVHRIKLLYLRPPKHVYVDFEDLNTGVTSSSMYVSKHCNSYAQNKGGDEYNVEVVYKSKGDKTWVEYQNLYSVFCQ